MLPPLAVGPAQAAVNDALLDVHASRCGTDRPVAIAEEQPPTIAGLKVRKPAGTLVLTQTPKIGNGGNDEPNDEDEEDDRRKRNKHDKDLDGDPRDRSRRRRRRHGRARVATGGSTLRSSWVNPRNMIAPTLNIFSFVTLCFVLR